MGGKKKKKKLLTSLCWQAATALLRPRLKDFAAFSITPSKSAAKLSRGKKGSRAESLIALLLFPRQRARLLACLLPGLPEGTTGPFI